MGVTWTLPFNLQAGQVASASQVMANFNAGVAALGNAAADGVNSDITALTALSTPITPAQGGTSAYYGGTTSGTNTIVTNSVTPTGFSLVAGKQLTFIAGGTNTGAATLNVNGLGAKSVFRTTPSGAQACTGGEIVTGALVTCYYDGTQFQLLAPLAQFGGVGPLTALASATTTDLGTIASHLVGVTGNTTITGFGSSASTTYPLYFLVFASALTLTYNVTSMILPGAADIVTAANDTALAAYAGSGNWQVIAYQRAASAPYRRKAPTYQIFTSGSAATYTAPTPRPTYLKVRAVGGGGGAGGVAAGTTSTAGGDTTFNSVVAVGGSPGAIQIASGTGQAGGAGGTGGTGTANFRQAGGPGAQGSSVGAGTDGGVGGNGGFAPFGNGLNSGAGGQGAQGSVAGRGGAGGGGAGEYFELIIDNPAATYTYTVGALGVAGTSAVTAAGAGKIIVEEFYN